MGAGWVKDRYNGGSGDPGGQNWWSYLPAARVAAVDTFWQVSSSKTQSPGNKSPMAWHRPHAHCLAGDRRVGGVLTDSPTKTTCRGGESIPRKEIQVLNQKKEEWSGMAPNNRYPWQKLMTSQDPHLVCQLYFMRLFDTFEGLLQLDYNVWLSLFPSNVCISEDFFR